MSYNLRNRTVAHSEPVKTEDLGKIFERAVCYALDTPFVGKYKYSEQAARDLSAKIACLRDIFPPLVHTARVGARYDFGSDGGVHLSVKTTKGQAKVAPRAFVEHFGATFVSIAQAKQFVHDNIVRILDEMFAYTFDCPILYYNQKTDKVSLITATSRIGTAREYSWTRMAREWKNSTTLKCDGAAIAEFQFHGKNRANMAIRWHFESVLRLFSDCFDVRVLAQAE